METKLKELLEELQYKKISVTGPLARLYAIMNTDLEKVLAFYLIFVKEKEEAEQQFRTMMLDYRSTNKCVFGIDNRTFDDGTPWRNELEATLDILRDWLSNEDNIDHVLSGVETLLRHKHEKYGEDNLKRFAEYGILVRSSDKIARIENMIENNLSDNEESRSDSWRDLAGYAIQALIMMSLPSSDNVNIFETRKNRLKHGMCPDCGTGVIFQRASWHETLTQLQCSNECGFRVMLTHTLKECEGVEAGYIVNYYAKMHAMKEQL